VAVFISASDETAGECSDSDFQIMGWIAPELDWSQFFAPAWQERVLDGPPKIPYLHVTDMRSRAWREKHGITRLDAESRLDEAASVIDTMGSLYPLKIKVDGRIFANNLKKRKFFASSGARIEYEPDYYAFLIYAFAVLCRVKVKYPEADKVDFVVEQRSKITKYVQDFYETLPKSLRHIGREDLIPLVGDFIPGSKERTPLQAADFLCWHGQRSDAGTLEDSDARRWNPIAKRQGFPFDVPPRLLRKLADAWKNRESEQSAGDGIRQLRPHDASADQRAARANKSRAGRREDEQTKEKAEG
jgi:hypothetical protein